MDKTLRRWEWIGFFVVGALGALLHFLFDWTGEAPGAGLLGAVNESTWEHMKLLFMPYFLWAVVEWLAAGRHWPGFWSCKALGVLAGLAAIPVLYYTYQGLLERNLDWLNVTIYYIALAAAFLLGSRCLRNRCFERGAGRLWGLPVLLILLALFVLFTYRTPHSPIFRDPVGNFYGLPGV